MKIVKTILIILGIALTSISFGQELSEDEGGILFYTLAYNPANMRLEHRLDEYPERHVHGDQFDVPMAARTYFRPMETEIAVESWMTNPFETDYFEVEPFVESWMTTPFESNYYEEESGIEPWMTTPFETDYYESEPFIESWMTVPFDLKEELEVEDWMTTSWI